MGFLGCRCLLGALCLGFSVVGVCLELSVSSCLFEAVCLGLSVRLFGGHRKLKMSQASKSVQNTYETFADRPLFGPRAPRTLLRLQMALGGSLSAFGGVC